MALNAYHHGSDAADAVSLARAETVGFDDIDTTPYAGIVAVSNGYAKLDWSNVYAINPTVHESDPNSGYFTGLTSGDQDAFSGFGEACSVYIADGSFTLNSVNMTAAWDLKLTVEITGYRDGELVYDKTVKLTDHGPSAVSLNFKGVDEVDFTPIKGKADPSLSGSGDHIVFDDFSFSKIKGSASIAPAGQKLAAAFAGVDGHGHAHVDAPHLPAHTDLHHPLMLA